MDKNKIQNLLFQTWNVLRSFHAVTVGVELFAFHEPLHGNTTDADHVQRRYLVQNIIHLELTSIPQTELV